MVILDTNGKPKEKKVGNQNWASRVEPVPD